ncbi:MAG: lipid II:glycine glycyltransferase FemX [Spirochaetaceae bacterium]
MSGAVGIATAGADHERAGVLSEVDAADYPPAAGFMQSAFWGRFKQRFGWQPRYFEVGRYPLLVLSRRLAPGYEFAYVPHGPELGALTAAARTKPPETVAEGGAGIHTGGVPGDCRSGGSETLEAAGTFAALLAGSLGNRTVALRLDLPFECRERGAGPADVETRLQRSPVDVQPPSTVMVDLGKSEDELLAAMKSKTRYNVRLAGKRGVVVRAGEGASDLERWYELYRETAARDRIAIHSRRYYDTLFTLAAEEPSVELSLLLAEHDRELIAGVILLRYGPRVTYLYGASSDHKRNLMAPYALQWEGMRRGRAAGAREYDMFGIPPTDDPGHPMHGLYRFKTGFGGRIVHRLGAWDYPTRRWAYRAYRAAERARNYYYKRLTKRRSKFSS